MGEVVKAKTVKTEDFVVPASDDHGANVVCNVRVQPLYMRQMQIMTAKGNPYGFRTVSDLVRHAIDREVRYLAAIGDVNSLLAQIDALNDFLRDDIFNAEFVKIFDVLDKIVARDIQRGNMNHAVKMILQAKQRLDKMEDGHYKSEYLKEWKDKYSRYLDNAAKASFTKGFEEDE